MHKTVISIMLFVSYVVRNVLHAIPTQVGNAVITAVAC